jgi:hypothetical protein
MVTNSTHALGSPLLFIIINTVSRSTYYTYTLRVSPSQYCTCRPPVRGQRREDGRRARMPWQLALGCCTSRSPRPPDAGKTGSGGWVVCGGGRDARRGNRSIGAGRCSRCRARCRATRPQPRPAVKILRKSYGAAGHARPGSRKFLCFAMFQTGSKARRSSNRRRGRKWGVGNGGGEVLGGVTGGPTTGGGAAWR